MYHIRIDLIVFLIIINYYQLFYKSHKRIFDNHATILNSFNETRSTIILSTDELQFFNSLSQDNIIHFLG